MDTRPGILCVFVLKGSKRWVRITILAARALNTWAGSYGYQPPYCVKAGHEHGSEGSPSLYFVGLQTLGGLVGHMGTGVDVCAW